MNCSFSIRPALAADVEQCREIHCLAFNGQAEATLVDNLRQSQNEVISLIAEVESQKVGHILLSSLQAPMKVLALAPIAIHPSFQRQGIGSTLVREGLERAKEDGWECIFVLGDPGYYSRFGFSVDAAKHYISPYSGDHFMALTFREVPKNGQIIYPEPFRLRDS